MKEGTDQLGTRMKTYEKAGHSCFIKQVPVIIRIDGKAFHTYTRGMKKPFDERISEAMWETTKYLCATMAGCKVGYTQSDEITLMFINDENTKSNPIYNNNKTKLESISASKATVRFNQVMLQFLLEDMVKNGATPQDISDTLIMQKEWAEFDSRAFAIPKHEAINNFIWRQQDAVKNSISMVAQANFSHKSLQGLNGIDMKKRLQHENNIEWDALPTWQQRGAVIMKTKKTRTATYNGNTFTVMRNVWEVDHETPIFTEMRDYIDQYVYHE